jgi:hypothetical protein
LEKFDWHSVIKLYFERPMEKGNFISRIAKFVGLILLIVASIHSTVGTAEVVTNIKVGGIMPSLVQVFKNVWVYSSMMLFLSGIWVLFLARDLGRFQRRAWWQGVLVGLGYAGGSITAMSWAGIQAPLVLTFILGLLLLLPLLMRSGAFKSDS